MTMTTDGFDEVIKGYNKPSPQQTSIDLHPYGIPANSIPVKPGLTPRGKAGIAISAAVLASAGLFTWQHFSAVNAANEAKAQQIQLEKERLEIEKLKALSEAAKTNSSGTTVRQKQIDACVTSNKDLVGKGFNSQLQDIVDACQAQYTSPSATGSDLQATASVKEAGSGGGSVNSGLLICGAVLVGGVFLVARKRPTVSNAQ
jgi:hypothetical protein